MRAKDKVLLVLLTILYLAIIVSTILLGSVFSDLEIKIGEQALKANTLLGNITVCGIIVSVALTCINHLYGGRIAFILMGVSLLPVSMSVIRFRRIESMPGILMIISGFIITYILRHKLALIDASNHFYQQISVTDPLTGTHNRRGMREHVRDFISAKTPFYLLFIDLDNFKYINDTIGHSAGDEVLATIAKRLTGLASANTVVSRTGGDEFVVIIPDREVYNIHETARDYIDAISHNIKLEDLNLDYTITGSIGISHYPEHSDKLDDIINYADTAMYEAKERDKNCYCIFEEYMESQSRHNKEVEAEINEGLAKNRFFLMYQPQFNTKTHELRGFESLIRLKDKDGNIVPPVEFIPIAEHTNLILDIDHYVLEYVMKQFSPIIKKAVDKFIVSVNISARHIAEHAFAKEVKQILDKYSFPPEYLEIEITEYGMLTDVDEATRTLNELHRYGVKIALDDFGTGYASLSNLTKLPIDLVKIDKGFTDNISISNTDNEFVEAIISMGHLLHCDIIAEGVETEAQLEFLDRSDCDYIQGYIWSKPMEFDDAVDKYVYMGQ